MDSLLQQFARTSQLGANAAYSFEQFGDAFGQGWRSQSSGYLSPRSWAFALAVFGELKGDDGGVGRYLREDIDGLRKQAVKYLRRRPELIAGLR